MSDAAIYYSFFHTCVYSYRYARERESLEETPSVSNYFEFLTRMTLLWPVHVSNT